MKRKIFTTFLKALFVSGVLMLMNNFSYSQSTGDFRSKASGWWHWAATWETYDGSTWVDASWKPTSATNVYIQSGHTVTIGQDGEACNDLHIAKGNASTNATYGRLELTDYELGIYGKLRTYYAAVGTIPGTSTTTMANMLITCSSSSGKLAVRGSTRTLNATGEWTAGTYTASTSLFNLVINADAGATISFGTNLKAQSLNVLSGTLDLVTYNFSADNGTSGQGDITIAAGATVKSSSNSNNIFQRTGNTPCGTLTLNGTLILTGTTPKIQATTYDLTNGTVKYDLAGAQTFASNGTGSTPGNIPLTYGNVTISNSGVKTLIASQTTTINGTLSLQGTASLALGTSSVLTYGPSSTLEYAGSGTQTTTTAEFPVTGVINLTINNPNEVIIDGSRVISGNAVVKPLSNLTLLNSMSLLVGSSGNFTIQSDATGTGSFVDQNPSGGLTVSGTSTAQLYLTGSGGPIPNGHYWYLGSPITAAGIATIFSPAGDNRLWTWMEGFGYVEFTNDGPGNMTLMKGYIARLGTTETELFSGTFNTGTIGSTDNLTRTGSDTYAGFNLVCNPYPSAVLFDITGTGLTRTNIGNTIWYRSSGVYPTYNFSDGTTANGGQASIPAMQAFWVNVPSGTNGTLIFTNASREHTTQSFYKEASESNVFRLTVNNGTYSDESVVTFFADALASYDNHDSYKMFNNEDDIAQIYTLTSANEKVIINGQPELGLSEERVLNLGFSTPASGTFTLDATNLDEFDATIPVYLEDTQEGNVIDLRQTPSYSFTSGVIDNADRFKLHFGGLTTGIESSEMSSVYAYAVNHSIYVNSPSANASIEVYDVLGNLIDSRLSERGLNTIHANVSKGIYIVKVMNGTEVSTQKIFID